jgi:glycosyltransferase involved in cell wall biosynthesis
MVVLEAMQHLVPVIYPKTSGAAEVLTSGVKVDAADTGAMADAVMRLLGDRSAWERAAGEAAEEIKAYKNRRYEDRLIALWTEQIARRQQAGATS